MVLRRYRRVLARPGVRSLIVVALLARVPVVATGIALTLHVVLDLDRGYAAAGLVGAAFTVGASLGAPALGRLVDRRGLRPMLVLCTLSEAVFWSCAPFLPYPALLAGALAGGVLALPVFSVVRQSLAAMVPEDQRRQAYALDSMSVELSFMTGPALAVVLATTVSPRAAMIAIGVGLVAAGTGLYVLNPPTRDPAVDGSGTGAGPVPERREWLRPALVAVLVVSAATTLVLAGTDVAIVAALRAVDQVQWTGAVLTIWSVFSLFGGFVYGAVRRAPSPVAMLAVISLGTIPVGLLATQWWWLGLALLPAGALVAPALAGTAEVVSRLVPSGARGEAMGLHGSALTVGLAIGAPLAGAVIDRAGPAWGFASIGIIGAVVSLSGLAVAVLRRGRGPVATLGTAGAGIPGAAVTGAAIPDADASARQ